MIAIPICALLMRVKGGGPDKAPKWFRDLDGSIVSSFLFAGLCAFYFPWWQALLCGVAWFAGNAPSIGEEIGAIGGYKGNWYSDRDSWIGGKLVNWIKSDKAWGWASCFLRGIYFGLCLALPTLNPWFVLAGATFPLAYFIGVSIQQRIENTARVGWPISEWLYGAIIGGAFYV